MKLLFALYRFTMLIFLFLICVHPHIGIPYVVFVVYFWIVFVIEIGLLIFILDDNSSSYTQINFSDLKYDFILLFVCIVSFCIVKVPLFLIITPVILMLLTVSVGLLIKSKSE